MRRVTTRIAALLLPGATALLLPAAIPAAARAADPEPAAPAMPMRIEQLDWMAGCWSRQAGERLVEEQWMMPRGGSNAESIVRRSRVVSTRGTRCTR